MNEERWKIKIVPRVQYFRRPRSKKRRIRNKWLKNPKNWRPMMVPVGYTILLGSEAARLAGVSGKAYGPVQNRMLEMSPALWEKVKVESPEFAAKCDLVEEFW